tara:strand:- start:2109 stop:2357 length:249 start_codon:yes stop_codon:yes gene_type:complete
MRDFNITKHKGNTHYTVNVTDSHGRHKGSFFKEIQDCYDFIYSVWEQETPLTEKEIQQDLLEKAIRNCVKLDKERGVEPILD